MEESYRPVALRVFAEWSDQDPVWDSDLDHMGTVDPTELGASPGLVEQLRAWNKRFHALGWTDYRWPDAEQERAWQQEGLRLAYQLQNELSDIEISYGHDGDDRPLRQRRGP
ncbi:hypothetical protein CLV92_11676 [Kineococcus xinjiangensis]|uniref:Uncharacterized protein n=1 Tax=Kineococcus xinjiangensis TaxID=512762 RepID=A0A2S6ID44_9ACTN|nr:hypothetical protein [Kineococcus xinjiangensis]PPK92135.1 hypothetical protein CLV92_117103 [Kineococcus xinjiangensis]PPK92214.1 hypothetical protein CLV92_11676 [Kineococcus xinjiangensis]